MKLVKAYRYTHAVGVLLLFCQLLCSTLSQTPNQNQIVDHEAPLNNQNDIGRVLEDSINSSATAEPTTVASNQSEAFPVVDNATVSVEPIKKPAGLPVSASIYTAVTSTFILELANTTSLLSREGEKVFLDITAGFLSFHIFKVDGMTSLVEREGIEVDLIGQTQKLIGLSQNDFAAPLYVTLQVTGAVVKQDIVVSRCFDINCNLNFDQVLEKIFVGKEEEYLEALKFIDGDYYEFLNNATIVEEHEIKNDTDTSINEEEDQEEVDVDVDVDVPWEDTLEDSRGTLFPNIFPTTESSNVDSIQDTNDTSGDGDIQGSFLSLGAIVGISMSGVLLLVSIAVFIYCVCVRGRKKNTRTDRNKSGGNTEDSKRKQSSPHKNKSWNRRSGQNDPVDFVAEKDLLMNQQPLSDKRSDVGSVDDLESQAMYSYNQGSSGSVFTNGTSVKVYSTNHSYSNYGSDSMSYAYSLEHGIEASVVGSVLTTDQNDFFNNENGSSMPIREIPQVRMSANERTGGVNHDKMTAQKKKGDNIMYDHFGNTQIETAPSDLKLTKSELEMLPSNLRGSNDTSDFSEKDNERLTRTVVAPAGKLGIAIDTSIEGPVVHSVREDSQLSGKIFSGDIIVAIDEVDTRAMSASDITALMIQTANRNRNLTVRGAL